MEQPEGDPGKEDGGPLPEGQHPIHEHLPKHQLLEHRRQHHESQDRLHRSPGGGGQLADQVHGARGDQHVDAHAHQIPQEHAGIADAHQGQEPARGQPGFLRPFGGQPAARQQHHRQGEAGRTQPAHQKGVGLGVKAGEHRRQQGGQQLAEQQPQAEPQGHAAVGPAHDLPGKCGNGFNDWSIRGIFDGFVFVHGSSS